MPEADTLTTGCFLYGLRTGTPPTYRAALEAVGTDGTPDGTALGGGSPASVTFTPALSLSVTLTVTLLTAKLL